MHEMKNTARALVRISFDGLVHKTFRGHLARERFEHESRVLRLLEAKGAPSCRACWRPTRRRSKS
jgi:hypothetical protein